MALNREKLKELMKLRGVTQKNIKDATGKEARTVSRWLSGENVPKDRDVRVIAALLKCEPIEFYKNFIDAPDEGVAMHATVSVASYNAYQVMALRYGVTQRDILEIAPILFSVVAAHALRVPQEDLDAYRIAKNAGLYVHIGGNAEEASGFELDERAAKQRDCFGIAADPLQALPRNLFAHALRRLCENLDGLVDAKGMYQPDAGEPLKAIGFNVDPEILSKLADGDESRIVDFATGRLRLPDRETLLHFGRTALDGYVERQTEARQAKLEEQRKINFQTLSAWQSAYVAAHRELDEEYQALAAHYYEPEPHVREGRSAEERDAAYADPFSAERVLKKGFSPYYFHLFGEVDQNEKEEATQVERLLKLERHRRASKLAFVQEDV